MNILHVGHYDKFLPKHITFTNENFNPSDHFFLMMDKEKKVERVNADNVKYISHKGLFSQIHYFYKADKIILHGLFEKRLLHMFFLNPWLIKKCYWMIWGGDLYNYLVNKDNKKKKGLEFFRKFLISRIPNFITYVEGDYHNAKKWYGANGKIHECLLYESNVFKPISLVEEQTDEVSVLLGNSASLSNNHLKSFQILEKFKDENIKIYSPLSYGKESHRKSVLKVGRQVFGDKFVPMLEMMPYDEYVKFLGRVDVAVFNHRRQQAMGNIITLLGLGKKVFMSTEVSSYTLFEKMGIKVFNIKQLDLETEFQEKQSNQDKIKEHFSKEKLLEQWNAIYSK